ncbi:MAG: homoserine dehydrogenase [Wolinella sp.]
MLKVGIIGVGTVGSSVAVGLEKNRNIIAARAGKEIMVKRGVVKDLSRTRDDVKIPITTNVDDILDDPEIDVVVELMGGVDFPFEVAKKALERGKSVVTANKAMLAYHRYDLQDIAGEIPIGFEASVAGGIPVIKALRDGLGANHVKSILGIMNGTCNFILTKMVQEGAEYEAVLKEAQKLGYAEADPTFDVGGFDAAHKLLILASIAYGIDAKPEEILIEGIERISQDEIAFAKEFGYALKLLGIAKKDGNEVELRVHPVFIPNSEMISKVDGVMNGISIIGDLVGETMYYGAGAGGDATASAVISDLIEIARVKGAPMLGFKKPMESGLKLKARDEIRSRYYLRIEVKDEPGVLAKIARLLGEQSISISTLLQKNLSSRAKILLSTHMCSEREVVRAISGLESLDVVLDKPIMVRIEG